MGRMSVLDPRMIGASALTAAVVAYATFVLCTPSRGAPPQHTESADSAPRPSTERITLPSNVSTLEIHGGLAMEASQCLACHDIGPKHGKSAPAAPAAPVALAAPAVRAAPAAPAAPSAPSTPAAPATLRSPPVVQDTFRANCQPPSAVDPFDTRPICPTRKRTPLPPVDCQSPNAVNPFDTRPICKG
jgi:hypothetical protein